MSDDNTGNYLINIISCRHYLTFRFLIVKLCFMEFFYSWVLANGLHMQICVCVYVYFEEFKGYNFFYAINL